MKRIAILGSTGSIGRSALAVVDAHPDRLAGRRARRRRERRAARRADRDATGPAVVAVATAAARDELRAAARPGGSAATIDVGAEGLIAVATHPDVDIVLCASSGTAGLEAVLAAIDAGKTIALANKEVLVMAGALMMDAARRRGVAILPVDSEHNAIHQCLHGRRRDEVRRLILTASGGPFRALGAPTLARVTPEDALRHPTWQMGRKITIDSATLMNKGLEVIEARWLFDVDAARDRRRHSPAVDRALDGRAARRVGDRAARRHRHAAADSVRVLVSGALGRRAAAARRHAARGRSSSCRPIDDAVSVSAAGLSRRSSRAARGRSC